MKVTGFLLGGVVAAVVIAGCSSNDSGAPPLPSAPNVPAVDPNAQLHPGSQVLPADISGNADVRDGDLRFPANLCDRLSALRPGQVIIGDRGAADGTNPDGFLRKVVSVQCTPDGVVVTTSPATLQETFDKLKLDAGFDLPACTDLSKPNLGVSYGGQILQYNDVAKTTSGTDVPFTGTVGIDLSLCLAPKIKYKADVEFLKLNSFEISATGILEAKATVDAAVTLDPSVDAKTREDLAGKPLTKTITTTLADRKVPLGSISAGPVSLPASLQYTTTLSCDLSFTAPVEVQVGAKETATLTAGLTYANGQLSPMTDKTLTFEPIPPTFKQDGMLRATCTITPKLQLKLFGIATGEIGARATGGMGASQTCGGKDAQGVTQRLTHGDVEAALVSTVLAKLDLLGVTKWKKECTLFSEGTTLPYDHAYPTPGGSAATTCSVVGPYPLPPQPTANPSACFQDDGTADGGAPPIIQGTCTHDVCVAGDKLGQQCDDCTMKVCAVDTYCCDTYWGLSCFDDVQKLCGKTCQ
jgi:hypothetical protein